MSPERINVYEAKTHFSRLIARVESGEQIVISRHGRAVARLVPYRPDRPARQPGLWKGRVTIAPDFDDFTAGDERHWYGA